MNRQEAYDLTEKNILESVESFKVNVMNTIERSSKNGLFHTNILWPSSFSQYNKQTVCKYLFELGYSVEYNDCVLRMEWRKEKEKKSLAKRLFSRS